MLLEQLFDHLALGVERFAIREVPRGGSITGAPGEYPALAFVLRGSGRLRCDELQASIEAYSLLLIPPRAPYGIHVGSPLTVIHGHIDARYAGTVGLFDTLTAAIVQDFRDSPEMRSIFDRILTEQRAGAPGDRMMLRALLSECLILMFRRMCADPDCRLPWLTALDDPPVAAAIAAVLDHPDEHHTIASLAEHALMSRSAFAERFHAATGRTPMMFVRDVRLRRAAAMLRTTRMPVGAIAIRAGFASRSSFSRAFRDLFGLSPGRFRRDRYDERTGASDGRFAVMPSPEERPRIRRPIHGTK